MPPAPERPAPGYGASSPPPGAGGPIAPVAYGDDVMGRYVLAGWWPRAGAQVIDGLIIGAGAVVLFIPAAAALGIGAASGNHTGFGAVVAALVFWVVCVAAISVLYAPVLMARTNGKTFGRMALGIRVVRAAGEDMTFGFAFLREVVVKAIGFGFAGSVTGGILNVVDYLWPLWDEENRCLHDIVVNTRVVRD
jgi:uncharacterized RDD family membrane protein YckC